MKKLFSWLPALLMLLWLPATAQDAAAQDVTVKLDYEAQYAGCFTASTADGPLTISEQNTVTLPADKKLYLEGTTKDGNIYAISGITFGGTPGAATEDMMKKGFWYVRNLTNESIVTINFTVTPVATDIKVTFVAEGASLSAIWLQGGYPRENITIPTDGILTVKSDKQPFAITATDAAYQNALMVSDVKVTGAGAENATVECTNPASGAWKVNGVADGQTITVVFSEIDTKTYKIPVVFNGIEPAQVDILRYADDQVMELTDGNITYSALDDNPIYISTAMDVTDNDVTDVKVEGAGIVDSSMSGFWILYNLGNSKITIYGQNATPEPDPEPATDLTVTLNVEGATVADIVILDTETSTPIAVTEEGKFTVTAEQKLMMQTGYDAYSKGLNITAITSTPEGVVAAESPAYPGTWDVSGLADGMALNVTVTAPAPVQDITVPVTVVGAEATDIRFTYDYYMTLAITDGSITAPAGKTLSVESIDDTISDIQITKGAGEAKMVADWGLWEVKGLEQGSEMTITVGTPQPEDTDITVTLNVEGATAADIDILTSDNQSISVSEEGKFTVAPEQMPLVMQVTTSAYQQGMEITAIASTPEGATATASAEMPGVWSVTGLADGMTLNVTVTTAPVAKDITVPVAVYGGDAKDLYIIYDLFMTVTPADVKDATEGDVTYQTCTFTMPAGKTLDIESYGELPIENIIITKGEGSAKLVNEEAGLWQVSGLTADSAMSIYYKGSGIISLAADEAVAADVYDLQGRRVLRAGQSASRLAPGLYISAGRKQLKK